jgi:hypothetical protein
MTPFERPSKSRRRSPMKTTTKQFVLAIAVSILAASGSGRARADITYQLVNDPVDQNGWTLSGSLTTDGTLGYIHDPNLKAWTFTISGFGQSDTYTNAESPYAAAFDVYATSTAIFVEPLGLVTLEVPAINGRPGILAYNPPRAYEGGIAGEYLVWLDNYPTGFGQGSWEIATTGVPEPSTMVMASLAVCCGIARALARGRKAGIERRSERPSL